MVCFGGHSSSAREALLAGRSSWSALKSDLEECDRFSGLSSLAGWLSSPDLRQSSGSEIYVWPYLTSQLAVCGLHLLRSYIVFINIIIIIIIIIIRMYSYSSAVILLTM